MTGGAGFIGSHLVDALLARGDEVMVVDDLSTGRRENLDGALAAGRGAGRAGRPRRGRRAERIGASAKPERSSTSRPRSTCACRSPTRPSTPRSTSTAPSTCSRRRARRAPERFVFASTGGAIYGEGEGKELPLERGRAAASRAPPTGRASSPPRATWRCTAAPRAVQREPAVRQRLRAAAGPARRGGRDRDLLRRAARRRTADRVRRRHPDPRLHIRRRRRRGGAGRGRARKRPGRSTSAPGARPSVLELVELLGELGGADGLRARSSRRPAPVRCSGSRSTRRELGASWAAGARTAGPLAAGPPLTSWRRRVSNLSRSCPPRPMPARSASASCARGSATSPACATCWRRPSTSPA